MYTREEFEEHVQLPQGAIDALTTFKNLRSFEPQNAYLRLPGLQTLADELVRVYQLPCKIRVTIGNEREPLEIDGFTTYTISLGENLSSISFLNAFSCIKQRLLQEPDNFVTRRRWVVNLFKTVDPESYARLTFDSHTGGFYSPGTQLGAAAVVRGITIRSSYEEDDITETYSTSIDTEQSIESGDLVSKLQGALTRTNGNVAQAATILGVSASTVRRRIERYGINLSDYRNQQVAESHSYEATDEFDDAPYLESAPNSSNVSRPPFDEDEEDSWER